MRIEQLEHYISSSIYGGNGYVVNLDEIKSFFKLTKLLITPINHGSSYTNFLEQTNPEDVRYELISGNGSILVNNVFYYCSKAALNISYTYHAYNLCAEDESDEFVILHRYFSSWLYLVRIHLWNKLVTAFLRIKILKLSRILDQWL